MWELAAYVPNPIKVMVVKGLIKYSRELPLYRIIQSVCIRSPPLYRVIQTRYSLYRAVYMVIGVTV